MPQICFSICLPFSTTIPLTRVEVEPFLQLQVASKVRFRSRRCGIMALQYLSQLEEFEDFAQEESNHLEWPKITISAVWASLECKFQVLNLANSRRRPWRERFGVAWLALKGIVEFEVCLIGKCVSILYTHCLSQPSPCFPLSTTTDIAGSRTFYHLIISGT